MPETIFLSIFGQIKNFFMKKNTLLHYSSCFFYSAFLFISSAFAQEPVIGSHPRIFLNAATKTALLAKKISGDQAWLELKADADHYLPGTVIPWNESTASSNDYYGSNDIFYSYCGSSWEEAAITLAMAHQMTKGTQTGSKPDIYSDKLMQLADTIIQAYATYPPGPNGGANEGINIFQYNVSFATRHVGKTIAVIYDWCYDELGDSRKTKLRNVMTDWFTYMSEVPYRVNQQQVEPTGNYFMGHVMCAAYTGYAIGSDDTQASRKMIAFARQRILGTAGLGTLASYLEPITNNGSGESAYNYFMQSVTGGLPSGASQAYQLPNNTESYNPDYINNLNTYTGTPQQDGIPAQGWTYGGETCNTLIDYCFLVKSATGESITTTYPVLKSFFIKTAESLVHSYTPNRFQYDNSNDNGSFLGCVVAYALPLRLAALLNNTLEGQHIQYFYNNINPVNLLESPTSTITSSNKGYPELAWEKLLYKNNRTATQYTYNPYYPVPSTNVYNSVPINDGLHKFYMRKDWGPTATWCTLDLGAAVYDQHNHNNAGHFKIIRGDSHDGDDHLLVGANEVGNGGSFGNNGIEGSTNYSYGSSFSNILYLDDGNDYDPAYPDHFHTTGGQTSGGYDEPTHEEQNNTFSYFRADLTSAYYVSYSAPIITERSIRYYYRSFLYLRNSDIFVVYDKFLVKASNNPSVPYTKHLRWHFMENPTISANGSNITATMDNSKLYVHTVLPATVSINKVNESNNPDNIFGDPGYFNTYTWRAEVSASGNPLKQDIVTVLQPGGLSSTEMATTAITTTQNNMEGSIVKVNGNTELVLFNNSTDKYPIPIASATYAFTQPTGSSSTRHTLCGLEPNGFYKVSYAGSIVTVAQQSLSTLANVKASPSGVLSFQFPLPTTLPLNLVSFTGKPAEHANNLAWTTSNESNTSRFQIERMVNDADFIKIDSVPAAGNSTTKLKYAFSDKNLVDGVSTYYYRLKMIDQNGDFTYSDVVPVSSTLNTFEAFVYPNPNNGSVTLSLSNPDKEKVLVEVFDVSGKKAISLNINSKDTFYRESYDWTSLAKGTYIVRISSKLALKTIKMMIQ